MILDAPRQLARRLLPPATQEWIKAARRTARLARGVHRLRRVPGDRTIPREVLVHLRRAWGNRGYSAPDAFLEVIADRARNTGGPILECGSGLSTLVLGVVAGQQGAEVWSLEHDLDWLRAIEAQIRRFRVRGVRLIHAPLRAYDGFDWYGLPPDLSLPANFTVIICDGPPGTTTRGGRYGLLPVLGDRFGPGAEILLDDAARLEEQAVVARWAEERPMRAEVDMETGRGIARLVLGGPPHGIPRTTRGPSAVASPTGSRFQMRGPHE